MKTGKIVMIVLVLGLLATAGGLVWLANAPMMPKQETKEQAIPDDRIPR